MDGNERQNLIKQLIYRSLHRGCKENDFLLKAFTSKYLTCLSNKELLDFALILDCSDNDIYDWITSKKTAPEHLNKKLIGMLKKLDLYLNND